MKEEETSEELKQAIALTNDRFEVIDKRIKDSTGAYGFEQHVLFDKVILDAKANDADNWFAFQLKDGIITPDDSISSNELEQLTDPEKAEEIIAQGYNLVTSSIQEDAPLEEQVRKTAVKHFYGYLVQQRKLEQEDDTEELS